MFCNYKIRIENFIEMKLHFLSALINIVFLIYFVSKFEQTCLMCNVEHLGQIS